jgi:L,D-peptidoglycan transpeptidase YkuD (ErfK/YbiS/YcfS/YnhG family)
VIKPYAADTDKHRESTSRGDHVPGSRPNYLSGRVTGLLAVLLCLTFVPSASAATPPYHPSNLRALGPARQVIVVTASSWSTSWATLRTYEKGGDGVWHAKFAPMRARIGGRGFAPAASRLQNSSETPAGTFSISRTFGRYSDPGTAMGYRKFDTNDWWPYDPRSPRTYNVYQSRRVAGAAWRASWAENLWSYGGQYGYAAVVNYNMPKGLYYSGGQWFAREPADTRKGGGIFLHISGPGSTAGCISISFTDMRAVLRWLDPAMAPRIVMGPASAITRM